MAANAGSLILASLTGELSMGKHTWYPTTSDVAQRAYELYEARGRQDGLDIDDWLRAEQELGL
jgi:DUF2934 family protein